LEKFVSINSGDQEIKSDVENLSFNKVYISDS
jgi:hypothetical protein